MGALIMANTKTSATAAKAAKAKAASARLDRRAVVKELLKDRGELLVVTGLGTATYDAAAAGDHDRNFLLWGGMGGGAMIGLGLAIAQPKKPVLVITGDGEQLMGMGALATIAGVRPPNLTIVVLDNALYAETGMQASHTAKGVDLSAVAAACGFAWTGHENKMGGIATIRERIHGFQGPGLMTVHIKQEESPRVLPSRDGVDMKNRFRRSLGLSTI